MKIINIIGHSNSGKTTLISKLIPLLAKNHKTASIKHMGHHKWELPEGKDTTIHYEAGALCSAGIDCEKSMIALEGTDVRTLLDIYDLLGFEFAVIEGFKEEGFSCVVLGELEAQNVILRNPTPEEVFAARDKFEDYTPKHHV